MGLSFKAIPAGVGRLEYLPAGNCCQTMMVRYSDGHYYHHSAKALHELPFVNTHFSFKAVPSPIIIDGDKSFEHVGGKIDIQYDAAYDQLQWHDEEAGWDLQLTRFWLESQPSNKVQVFWPGDYERRSGLYLYQVHRTESEYWRRTYYAGTLVYEQYETFVQTSTTSGRVKGHYLNGKNPYSYDTSARPVAYVGYSEIPGWNSKGLQLTMGQHMVKLQTTASELKNLIPASAAWDAALKAADGVKSYDLNMVEALLNFGIDDLVPKGLSMKSINALDQAIKSKNPIIWMCRLMQISGSMYLYDKYVVSNNVRDLSEITGISPDITEDLIKAAQALKHDGVEAQHINENLYEVARRVSFDERYFSSTYGAVTSSAHLPLGDAYIRTNARLRAYPGPYQDISDLGIILDEFGLKMTASRLIEAVPWEFVANWFLPIERTVHSIEYNDAHLNVLYNVRSLTISHSIKVPLNDTAKSLLGLSHAHVDGSLWYYIRTVSDSFPETVLDFSNGRGGISFSRLLQGSSLIITK